MVATVETVGYTEVGVKSVVAAAWVEATAKSAVEKEVEEVRAWAHRRGS